MEALRSLQRQTLRQIFNARRFETTVQHAHRECSQTLRHTNYASRHSFRFLHTRLRNSFTNAPRSTHSIRQTTRRFASSTTSTASSENLSLSQRLKKLSREYGWSALGVYLLLSAADFPFCFLAVRLLGTDRIGHWEHVVMSTAKEWVKWPFDSETQDKIDGAVNEVKTAVKEKIPIDELKDHGAQRVLEEDETFVVVDHGYAEASAANKGSNASIWTQLALAYAIHKSFIFIRVPLTAAVTPKVVKTLRSWGWNVGKRPAKTGAAASSPTGTSGVNTSGSGVKSR